MAAIKFSKQNIKPNPSEVDYWVDITSNPYGGRLKYFNGTDWVDLVNVDDSTVDLNGYYTKLQINQMLSDKASVSSVESKVDDDEIKDVIKNIDIKDIGNDGVQLVLFKYDNTNVAVTFPVASLTTSGIVTAESFKDFVKQHQLQQLYTEMYNKLSEIRITYQKKLKAGTNIKIDENNTIHAVSDVSLDWEDIYNKPDFNAEFQAISNQVVSETNRAVNAENQLSSRIDDHVSVVEGKLDLKANSKDIYTKDQIDEKISGVYRIKGSRSFNDLPDVNKIGDVYNISNEFVLDGITYPVGTNIVYTTTGWDALSGIFDYTGLEDSVLDIDIKIDEEIIRAKEKELQLDKKFDNYLPLSGGTIGNGTKYNPLTIKGTDFATLPLNVDSGTYYFGYQPSNGWFVTDKGWHETFKLLHSDNYSKYALPLSGGTLTGNLRFTTLDNGIISVGNDTTIPGHIYRGIYNSEGNVYDHYYNHNVITDYTYANLRVKHPSGFKTLRFGGNGSFSWDGNKVWHEGNDGEGSGLDADTIDGLHKKSLFVNHKWSTDMMDANTGNLFGVYYYGNDGINMPNSSGQLVAFNGMGDKYQGMQLFCFNEHFYFRSRWGNYPWKKVAFTDSTVENANKLNNKPASDFYDLKGGENIPSNSDLNDYTTPGTYHIVSDAVAKTIGNIPVENAGTLIVSNSNGGDYKNQRYRLYIGSKEYSRMFDTAIDGWRGWVLVSLNLNEYNAPTATKLQTPVKLWGNDFDGSSDISGQITLNNNTSLSAVDTNGKKSQILKLSASNNLVLGGSSAENGFDTYIRGNNIRIQCGSTHLDGIYVNDTGNIGIGTTDPQGKLDIAGTLHINGKKAITDDSGSDYVLFGNSLCPLYIRGTHIGILSGKNSNTAIIVAENGNVGLGTTNPQYKLDVGGYLHSSGVSINNEYAYCAKNKTGDDVPIMRISTSDNLIIGLGVAELGRSTYIHGHGIIIRSLGDVTLTMSINLSGNVTIGDSDLASTNYKLYVNGSLNLTDSIYLSGSPYIRHKKGDYSIFGNSTTETYVRGSAVKFQIDQTSSMIINPYGNVTMGTSDLAGINNRLYVDGVTVVNNYVSCKNLMARNGESTFAYSNYSDPAPGKNAAIKISGNVYQANGEIAFNGQITSGDLVDWYGVSWSEDSSDPTCTRIGNMALHRSLPILSAMKGYHISTALAQNDGEIPIPLLDDWSGIKYGRYGNGSSNTPTTGNVMIKIPEFWYIDDYESSTKTHNLKISQTAKAGWCHHKEAYVGAYEGYNDSTYYRSTKGVIPTVSVNRETIRTKARANGYEDEYKWNIYTYEEHRAICHLFLVEYATRDSQTPVNTALTADGFKQGGLGSGCTTGTVKINGVDTYSFIPTGTTDSLGNGSGQVTYTVTLTDADGNEIDTVTRYANRYRGIENPFGHIWKHVDDIVNVYNAETTYKTVYKCNKPEHFATNKNAKYKPLCSFPGGSKMQGWSKEIKATINCDFFKYSVGNSESTYWCDYNYDNDDTSEHCLLIGGRSGYGGWAGLFSFSLNPGVSHSDVNFGSRLTYLPWAE